MTRDEIRMKLWCDVYKSLIENETMTAEKAGGIADQDLKQFDKRFPAESSEPVDEYEGRVGATAMPLDPNAPPAMIVVDEPRNEQCPVCGFYCLGRGGSGCIDKPSLYGLPYDKEPRRVLKDGAVDEPRTVWVIFNALKRPLVAHSAPEKAKESVDNSRCDFYYAEFQQVGPMVRRDDD